MRNFFSRTVSDAFHLGFMISRQGFNGECAYDHCCDGLAPYRETEAEFKENMLENEAFQNCLREALSRRVLHPRDLGSRVMIDHREWKNWRDDSPEGAIGKLNELLALHGVEIALAGPDENEDFIELEARS